MNNQATKSDPRNSSNAIKRPMSENDNDQVSKRKVVMDTQTTTALSPSAKDECINVLLLGESGVGKSTFINAFINYLTFNTLEEAVSNEPLALIPVSFLITTGNDFTEHIVKFDVSDASNNEDFTHPGQSVTQHCRSYEFQLKDHSGKKLCIIDTPGFGDTRGVDHDDLNMKHILDYTNRFPHLNAVCFLLKPNASRLNVFFRTCLIQLLDFLGSKVPQNVIFCFTNSRATFYAPGDTGPLLRAMLESIPGTNIPFQKENSFCFDSESFRYLVALKNGVTFSEEEKSEYEASWVKSVTEFNRLLDHIQRSPIEHAQFEITMMIRPILETMRNYLRNTILMPKNSSERSIASFWFIKDWEDDVKGNCHSCSSISDRYVTLDYGLDYDISGARLPMNKDEVSQQISFLTDVSAKFSHFLMNNAVNAEADQFLAGLNWLLAEENYICTQTNGASCNRQLSKELETLVDTYTKRLSEAQQDENDIDLETISNLIQIVGNIPEVNIQVAAAKRTRKNTFQSMNMKDQRIQIVCQIQNPLLFEALIIFRLSK